MEILREFPELEQLMQQNFAGVRIAKPAIMIAMTPRTGSTQFCAALIEAGFQGRPSEIFNPRGVIDLEKRRLKVKTFEDYINALQAGPAAEFIFKTSWGDFRHFAPYHHYLFPNLRVIYLDRKDWAAQAVSQFRAEVSGFWHQGRGQAKPPPELIRDKFDGTRVKEIIYYQDYDKKAWERFFSTNGYAPLRLEYQDIATDINAVLRKVSAEMQLTLRDDLTADFGYQKIADWLSEEWKIEALKLGLGLS